MAQVLKDGGVLDIGAQEVPLRGRPRRRHCGRREALRSGRPSEMGTGREISIRDLAGMIAELIKFEGQFRWNIYRLDLKPRRAIDLSWAERAFGWKAKVAFEGGLRRTIDWHRNVGFESQALVAR